MESKLHWNLLEKDLELTETKKIHKDKLGDAMEIEHTAVIGFCVSYINAG